MYETYGYLALAEPLNAVVADIRFSPRSRIPQWTGGRLAKLLAHQPVILLCACSDLQRCHRRLVAEAVAARFGVQVTHL